MEYLQMNDVSRTGFKTGWADTDKIGHKEGHLAGSAERATLDLRVLIEPPVACRDHFKKKKRLQG